MIRSACRYFYALKKIHWNWLSITICTLPFVCILAMIFLLIFTTADRIGAVVSTAKPCANIGRNIFSKGGTAVDAAIAMLLCEGVAMPGNAGIGGGFSAIIFMNGKFDTIVATPTAPAAVAEKGETLASLMKHKRGSRAAFAGIPGELMGFWEMHQKYGVLPWRELVEPSIKLCEEGIEITQWYASILRNAATEFNSTDALHAIFPQIENIDRLDSETGGVLKFPILAETLRQIADHGASAFYNGPLGKKFIKDVQNSKGIITEEDLRNFRVSWNSRPVVVKFKAYRLYTTPLPTAGVLTAFILNILRTVDFKKKNERLFWHSAIEAMKHAFGHRLRLGDYENDPEFAQAIRREYDRMISLDYAREVRKRIKSDRTFNDSIYYGAPVTDTFDGGTANICVSSTRGDAVVATSSLSTHFGSFFRSNSTGIVLNNQLLSFVHQNLQIAPHNRMLPGKRPLSLASPSIILHQPRARTHLLIAASGGPKIATLIANSVIKFLWMGHSLHDSVNGIHFHNQLFPNIAEYDVQTIPNILKFLTDRGHQIKFREEDLAGDPSVICIGNQLERPTIVFSSHQDGGSAIYFIMAQQKTFLTVLLLTMLFCGCFIILYHVYLNDKLKRSTTINSTM